MFCFIPHNRKFYVYVVGAGGSVVVKALCHKLEGRVFDTL
jgi:hypothetical protein